MSRSQKFTKLIKLSTTILLILTVSSYSSTTLAVELSVSKDPKQSFYQVMGSRFSTFIVENPAQLAQYQYIYLNPISFEQLTLIKTGKRKIDKSWDFNQDYTNLIQEEFIKSGTKVFAQQGVLEITEDAAKQRLFLQFFMDSFEPDTFFYSGVRASELDRLKRVGIIKFRMVVTDFHTGKMLAIASATSTVARNSDTTANSKFEHKMAWDDTLSNWQQEFLDIVLMLKQQ